MSSWRMPGGDQGTDLGGLSVLVKFSLPPEKRGNRILPLEISVKSEGFIYIYINTTVLEGSSSHRPELCSVSNLDTFI